MFAAEKQPFLDRANLELLKLPQQAMATGILVNSASLCGLGSEVYPLAAEHLNRFVQELLPDGKQWVRQAYDACLQATAEDSMSKCIVRNSRPPIDLPKLRRQRKADATCNQEHPGLCICDSNASSIRSFHHSLNKAFQTFNLDHSTCCGEALFLFCGYKRKAHAEQARRRVQNLDVDHVAADEFELAFLSDEPERRKGLKVFTRVHCRIDAERRFNFGCHAGLVATTERTFDERVGQGFSKFLRDRCRYWLCFWVTYEDVETEFHVVKVPRRGMRLQKQKQRKKQHNIHKHNAFSLGPWLTFNGHMLRQ